MMTPTALRIYRKTTGISLRALADEIGVHYSTLYRFEKGEVIMTDSWHKINAWGTRKGIV